MILPPRVLFVGAHCDDIELIAGGLLHTCCVSKRQVGVLVFSDHRGVIDETRALAARREHDTNMAWLRETTGAMLTDHSGVMFRACSGEFESRRGQIYAALEVLRDSYDLVVTHSAVDTNQDHQQVAKEAARVFKSHASVWGGEFPNNDLGTFEPRVYIALEAASVDGKIAMVERYASQRFGGRPYLDADVVRALARLRGSQIRSTAAEAFEVGTRIIVRG